MNKIILTKGASFTVIWPFKYNGISGANDNLGQQKLTEHVVAEKARIDEIWQQRDAEQAARNQANLVKNLPRGHKDLNIKGEINNVTR